MTTKDATGKKVVVGGTYGYTNSKNGFTFVYIGTALTAVEGKVSLLPTESYISSVYDEKDQRELRRDQPKRSVRSINLFPVTT